MHIGKRCAVYRAPRGLGGIQLFFVSLSTHVSIRSLTHQGFKIEERSTHIDSSVCMPVASDVQFLWAGGACSVVALEYHLPLPG